MMTKNKNLQSLGHFKRKMKILNKSLQKLLQKNIWPLTNFTLKQKVISLIEKIQFTIACLKSLNKFSEALHYVEYFSFSLANRLLSIENIRTILLFSNNNTSRTILKNIYNFKTCLFLVSLTHPKRMNTSCNLEIKHVKMLKKKIYKIKVLKLYNMVDHIIQLQILTFLDSFIDSTLPGNFYGFRKGRSPLQAIAYLSKHIQSNDTSNRYHLVSIDIHKCFDSISHEFT